MRATFPAATLAALIWAVPVSRTLAEASSALPADVPMNENAGRGGLLYVPVRIDGGEEVLFVVDSGSSRCLIDKSLEATLGKRVATASIQSWGKTNLAAAYKTPKLTLGGTEVLTGGTVLAWDLKGLSRGAGRPVMGMLSFDCLKNYCVQLDFEAGKVRFLDSKQLDPSKLGKAFPMYFQGRPFIHHAALLPGTNTNSLIDSGFDADGRVEFQTLDAKGTGRVHLGKCAWDGDTYTDLIVGRGENANLLGLRFLARHLVTLDFPHQTLYLLRRSQGPLPPAQPEHHP